ncbi:PREDICTED: HD domain-containing protein 2 [Miniopterus natalensis]|uniref:HD domain-containing protein 2 n=1 Tax=Miniopterus natalensis TaxID=291302 RepID=UPI0007A6D99F|nr:PREDICTED: HD domain-containing protein 2 [Miniopterus natalensis]
MFANRDFRKPSSVSRIPYFLPLSLQLIGFLGRAGLEEGQPHGPHLGVNKRKRPRGLCPLGFGLRRLALVQRVPRTGWVYRNVERPESVSDHMYRMAVMALVTNDDHLNKDRCVRLALVHDMAECIVGDIAPADNIPKEEKHRREEEAMKQLAQLLSKDLGKELYELWEEYETQSSAEAKFVKQLDQCEMILQASEYEDLENKPGRLQDFYDSTAGKFSHPEILQLVSELEAERNANIAAAASEPHS